MTRVTIREARARFGELVRLAQHELVVVVRGASGSRAFKPHAVLIGVDGLAMPEAWRFVAHLRPRHFPESRRDVEPIAESVTATSKRPTRRTTPKGRPATLKRRKGRRS